MCDDLAPTKSASRSELRDRAHLEQVLRKSGTVAGLRLAELSECEGRLLLLISARIARAWTNEEHATYLELRRHQQVLRREFRRELRTFDHARSRMHGIDAGH